ncbi:MAG: acetate/propionate family kinase [Thermoguttaceae bacterium]
MDTIERPSCCVLTINSGSSSVKAAVYRMGPALERLLFSGSVERIGLHGGRFHGRDAEGQPLVEEQHELPDHETAIQVLLPWLEKRLPEGKLDAVGHRVVHGGPDYVQPVCASSDVVAALQRLIRLAPEHLPHELSVVRAIQRHYPSLQQVLCFDTAFHRHMPEVAQRYPLPRSLWHEGVRRYGFHGLSYEYILQKLEETAGRAAAHGRLIIAHLGNGASMASVRDGVGCDTTMGLTPAGGLVMGTRSGDLDPGVLVYLLREKGRSAATVDYLVNERAGLIGVSDVTSDMRDLLQLQATDPYAAQAIELYCYQARKYLASMAAVLGGLDTLVFTAGVGAGSPEIRRRICKDMEFLGIRLDPDRNNSGAEVISDPQSAVTIRVMKTDEEVMLARHTYQMLCGDLGI